MEDDFSTDQGRRWFQDDSIFIGYFISITIRLWYKMKSSYKTHHNAESDPQALDSQKQLTT